MQDLGPQYSKDDRIDKSGFLKRARLHQSRFRVNNLKTPFDTYGNYLTQADGESGKNFYDDFEIFEAVKKYRKYNKALYSNMLRSEHIPFNFFIPFRKDLGFLKSVLNEFYNNSIQKIERVEIEYAPPTKSKYLDDATSFDAYIEYTHVDNSQGIIGIEVKYTEKDYKLKTGSKEDIEINATSSRYNTVTNLSGLYKPEALSQLKSDRFRQVWRSQLLGESILQAGGNKFKHFTSLTLFPEGNSHFIHTSEQYIELLVNNNNKFLPLTYEAFLSAAYKHFPDERFKKWLDYLTERYIISIE